MFIIAFLMASKIIYAPILRNKNSTQFLKPILIGPEFGEYSILELLSKIYKNYIFDIIYIRVAVPGTFLKFYGLKALKTILITSFLACIIFSIQFIKFIFNFKRNINFTEFLYLNYDNFNDSRNLSFINNGWEFNPKKEFYKILIQNKPQISEHLIYSKYTKFQSVLKTVNPKPDTIEFVYTQHREKNSPKIMNHYTTSKFPSTSENTSFYITDVIPAEPDYYGHLVKAPLLFGTKKDSVLLYMDADKIKYYNKYTQIRTSNISQGLARSDVLGINTDLMDRNIFTLDGMDKKILKDYKDYKEIFELTKLELEKSGIDTKDYAKAFKYLLFPYI